MPRYRYKAKEGPDKTVERELVADSQAAAVARIEALGLIPIWVREAGKGVRTAAGRPASRGISRGNLRRSGIFLSARNRMNTIC